MQLAVEQLSTGDTEPMDIPRQQDRRGAISSISEINFFRVKINIRFFYLLLDFCLVYIWLKDFYILIMRLIEYHSILI